MTTWCATTPQTMKFCKDKKAESANLAQSDVESESEVEQVGTVPNDQAGRIKVLHAMNARDGKQELELERLCAKSKAHTKMCKALDKKAGVSNKPAAAPAAPTPVPKKKKSLLEQMQEQIDSANESVKSANATIASTDDTLAKYEKTKAAVDKSLAAAQK